MIEGSFANRRLRLGFGGEFYATYSIDPRCSFSNRFVISAKWPNAGERARKASTDAQWNLVGRQRLLMRRLAISLTALVTLVNFGALARLVEAILAGNAGSGRTLLLDALNIWATNVIIFALWYWALDRGSPATKGTRPDANNDFLFTQQQPAGETCLHPGWTPGFIDYLFLAFTNATAFSPADTFPLTVRAKLLMMAEAGISFATIALVASRAVGILN